MITSEKQYGLTPEQVEFYRENGYLHVPGVFTPEEAALFREEAHALARRLVETHAPGVVGEGWGSGRKVTDLPRELLHCHNVQFHSALFSRLIVDTRRTDRAADRIGPNVQLHHPKLFTPPPERPAPFPRDHAYRYFAPSKHTTMA